MKPEERIMEAYYRRTGREDQATEVFATALDQVPGYANLLADQVDLDPADTHLIETQVISSSNRVDLEVRGLDEDGSTKWLLWSEHKLDATFGKRQLARYSAQLRDRADGSESRLIAITLRTPPPDAIAEAERENAKRRSKLRSVSSAVARSKRRKITLLPTHRRTPGSMALAARST